jgi:hypothetical protein
MNDETTTTPQQTPQTQPAFDPSAISAAVKEAFTEMQQTQQQTQPQREMSPEERAEFFQVFDPMQNNFVDEFTTKLADPDLDAIERAKVISTFRDGLVNQALRGAELMIEQKLASLNQQIAPAVEIARKQQTEKLWNDFTTAAPELKEHREIVDAVAAQLAQSGFRPKDQNELFSRVADMSRGILSKAGVNLPQSQQQFSGGQQMPRMSSTNVGNGGNGGSPSGGQAPSGKIASFFLNRQK